MSSRAPLPKCALVILTLIALSWIAIYLVLA